MTVENDHGPARRRRLAVVGLCLLAIGPGLGRSRLSYHEAFVAQGGSEILASGSWSYPTIAGLPWLEKPPLPFWSAAAMGALAGEVSPVAAEISRQSRRAKSSSRPSDTPQTKSCAAQCRNCSRPPRWLRSRRRGCCRASSKART